MKTRESSVGLKFRKFNRFYTNVLGFLNEHIYDSPFSLTETRILFEIYNTPNCTAKALQDKLGLDRGYVSRIVKQFEKEDLIYKQRSKDDARHHYIFVTETGKTIYKKLEEKANEQVELMLNEINQKEQHRLAEAMAKIEEILSQSLSARTSEISIRDYFLSEDLQLLIEKQRQFYAEAHGWDDTFLAYLQETFDAKIEKIWIAESGGKFAGSVGLVKHDEKTVQLRWFLVDADFRGRGLGTQLLEHLVAYCQDMKFDQIFLWTVSTMAEARPLYKKFGFRISEVKQEASLWGQQLTEERWDLELS
ncbi:helix-turn-helix domain-containing GNAT family N-acetyltransferase [Bacillus subtilis]|uniref:bifunctional helix-turn-helix transcriptional regulator/GNAT family N-acetyltransferase n=1 Tax=Bacillus subtilis TaxID=1423 RepID=UPI0021B0E3A2|nr:helix-turn-helix domain-containing GNAT family N-acetyltransferase [Bacillus subtilis]MCT6515171.1 helix-turn-helix domain-containing GNAT family N-acetyltransferase [Bacillus subtilis]MEC0390632.1 helix-turn-helix domain-containing GNAT family N-acetyltransferase [Bacillus subtilis]MEC0434685.1 helix-turn-helix domain-containing GNAT family N-acetyltransferase [Bacillus subtilis]WRU06067.1 helix-turn-helix domain-containing GNAT family N-acetyltransferase [Bacillus subtilis]